MKFEENGKQQQRTPRHPHKRRQLTARAPPSGAASLTPVLELLVLVVGTHGAVLEQRYALSGVPFTRHRVRRPAGGTA